MKRIFLLLFFSFFIISCSSENSDSDNLFLLIWKFLPDQIDSFKSFVKVWFILFCLDILISLLINVLIGLRLNLSKIILFFLVIFLKDYGFFITILLLFSVTIVTTLIDGYIKLRQKLKENN